MAAPSRGSTRRRAPSCRPIRVGLDAERDRGRRRRGLGRKQLQRDGVADRPGRRQGGADDPGRQRAKRGGRRRRVGVGRQQQRWHAQPDRRGQWRRRARTPIPLGGGADGGGRRPRRSVGQRRPATGRCSGWTRSTDQVTQRDQRRHRADRDHGRATARCGWRTASTGPSRGSTRKPTRSRRRSRSATGPTRSPSALAECGSPTSSRAARSRIDPATDAVARTITVGNRPAGIAVAGGLVWVGAQAADTSHRGGTLTVLQHAAFGSPRSNRSRVTGRDPRAQMTNDGSDRVQASGRQRRRTGRARPRGLAADADRRRHAHTPSSCGRGIRYSNGQLGAA